LESTFQHITDAPLTTTRRKVLDYLGMKINYHRKGKTTLSMQEYISKLLNQLPYDTEGFAKTPATRHIFNNIANKLKEEKHNCSIT